MSDTNPYQSPENDALPPEAANAHIERVASGQKMIIFAILVHISSVILQIAVHPLFAVLGLVALVLSFVGIIKLALGLGSSLIMKILYLLLMFIPLINLITLLVLNGRATKVLRSSLITSFTSPSLVFFRHASFVLSRNSSAIPCLRPALLGKKMPALGSKIGYETASRESGYKVGLLGASK